MLHVLEGWGQGWGGQRSVSDQRGVLYIVAGESLAGEIWFQSTVPPLFCLVPWL